MGDLRAIRDEVEVLVKKAGEIALRVRGDHNRQLKADGSIVTLADREIETMLRRELVNLVPGTEVWGEEEGHSHPGENGLWLVDPVDGTSNYSFGSPLWGVSVGLYQAGKIVVGAVCLPDLRETLSAHLGGGATLNGVELAPIQPGAITRSELVSYNDDTLLSCPTENIPGKMRYNGAFVVEAAFVAKGVYRGMISHRANLYDIAASKLIVEELGAEVRYFDGTELDLETIIRETRIERPFTMFPKDSGCNLGWR
ncbi:MAG: inositol monophosphatase family protein [Armatimonadetes bacterium]|nr:inositol monophosphatase family protein [Armatimonadota bacterium]